MSRLKWKDLEREGYCEPVQENNSVQIIQRIGNKLLLSFIAKPNEGKSEGSLKERIRVVPEKDQGKQMAKEKRHDNYAYDLEYEASPEQKHRRALRNKARRKALREGKVHKGDAKDIHHPDHGLMGGIKIVDRAKNRSWK
jgi:hypothetical protein